MVLLELNGVPGRKGCVDAIVETAQGYSLKEQLGATEPGFNEECGCLCLCCRSMATDCQ